jgi:hypothetical protein
LHYFIEEGYNITPEDFPQTILPSHIDAFYFLQKNNVCSAEIFDWSKHKYRCFGYSDEVQMRLWMKSSGCPVEIMEKNIPRW